MNDTGTGIWYATREQLKATLDFQETARANARLDRVLESSSRAIEAEFHRPRFWPLQTTLTFDWPPRPAGGSYGWRLWLNQHTLVWVDQITAGGVVLDPEDFLLRPDSGPPFTHVELDLSRGSSFAPGATFQRNISITGGYGYQLTERPAGELAAGIDAAVTTVDVSDGSAVGVGSLLRVDTERLVVTGRRMLDTGETIGEPGLSASAADVAVPVDDATTFALDEVIQVDAERMLVVDHGETEDGDVLVVRRAYDGSTLAAHEADASLFASRRLTVRRAAAGTTAASHLQGAPVAAQTYPGPLTNYCLALGINALMQESSGYARTVGSAEHEQEASGRGIRSARAEAWTALARKSRIRGI